jgi:hypothetical protein
MKMAKTISIDHKEVSVEFLSHRETIRERREDEERLRLPAYRVMRVVDSRLSSDGVLLITLHCLHGVGSGKKEIVMFDPRDYQEKRELVFFLEACGYLMTNEVNEHLPGCCLKFNLNELASRMLVVRSQEREHDPVVSYITPDEMREEVENVGRALRRYKADYLFLKARREVKGRDAQQ